MSVRDPSTCMVRPYWHHTGSDLQWRIAWFTGKANSIIFTCTVLLNLEKLGSQICDQAH